VPDPALLTPMGQKWRGWLPVVLRDSPDHLAVVHAVAKETERLEAAIEQVRAQFVPQTADVLLKVYEAQLGITIEPVGATLDERRMTVLAMLRKQASTPSGLDWQANVTRLVGAGWTYSEHDPADPSSPPAYTIEVRLPFPPSSTRYAQTERLIRDITPAHLDLIITYAGGFVLDQSQLDQEALQ
jgi:hypothetical protein